MCLATCSFPALVRAKGRAAFLAVGNPLCVLLPTFELSLKVHNSWRHSQDNRICDALHHAQFCELLQVAAIEAVTLVIESQLVPGSDVVDLLLPSVLANINAIGTPDEVSCPWHSTRSPSFLQRLCVFTRHSRCLVGKLAQVVNAWLKCFHALVPLLDKALIKAKILPVALAKGANDETSVQSRVICCAMLGSMAACLTKVIVIIIFMPSLRPVMNVEIRSSQPQDLHILH